MKVKKKILKKILIGIVLIGVLGALIICGSLIHEYYYSKYLPQKEIEQIKAEFNTPSDSIKIEVAKKILKKNDEHWMECKAIVISELDSLRQEAFDYIENKAKNGNVKCQSLLGYIYGVGERDYYCVYQDNSKSLYWYKEAANNGDISACDKVGFAYQWGMVVKQDIGKAVEYYKKGAEGGDPAAQISYGDMFVEGVYVNHKQLVPKDLNQAKSWWKKAEAQGNPMAKDRLQKIYD